MSRSYGLAIDTILVCFCEDRKVNSDGTYYMSTELQKLIGAKVSKKGKGGGKDAAKKGNKFAKTLRDGTPVCQAFQSGKCQNNQCKARHVCAVIKPGGREGGLHRPGKDPRARCQAEGSLAPAGSSGCGCWLQWISTSSHPH